MKKLRSALFIILALALSSCQVTENIALSADANTSEGEIAVYDFFIETVNSFSELLDEKNRNIVDEAVSDLAGSLAENINNSNVVYAAREGNEYTIAFDFLSISDVFGSLGTFSIFTETETSLSFYLDIDNYSELKSAIAFLSDPNFEVYGPEYNIGMSEDDYLEMISYLLGEDAPDAIKSSIIEISFTLPSSISDASGVIITSDNSCTYSFPLIDFLLLSEPMSFYISWS